MEIPSNLATRRRHSMNKLQERRLPFLMHWEMVLMGRLYLGGIISWGEYHDALWWERPPWIRWAFREIGKRALFANGEIGS